MAAREIKYALLNEIIISFLKETKTGACAKQHILATRSDGRTTCTWQLHPCKTVHLFCQLVYDLYIHLNYLD